MIIGVSSVCIDEFGRVLNVGVGWDFFVVTVRFEECCRISGVVLQEVYEDSGACLRNSFNVPCEVWCVELFDKHLLIMGICGDSQQG